jgi:hypothetical protein
MALVKVVHITYKYHMGKLLKIQLQLRKDIYIETGSCSSQNQ